VPEEPLQRLRIERWFPLFFLACAFVAVSPVFSSPSSFAAQYDWRYFESWIEVGRRSLVWFHQMPLWNPYGCGGEVLLANPQSEVGAPTMLLPVIFGTALGVKLVLVFYLFCAFDGMYRLGRDHELSVAGAWMASALFGAGGWLALHLSSGHSNFASAGLFPYLVLFYRRGNRDWLWTLPFGAVAAWVVCLGGTSTPAMAVVLLATVGVTDSIKRRTLRPFATLAAGGAWAALLGAYRILPALEFAIDHPRRQWETDANTIWQMIANGYTWKGLESVAGKRYWFHEYGWRISYITPPFIGLSFWSKKTRAWWWVALVGAGIVAGSAIPYGPWWLLKHLPIYRDLRVPSRYALLFAVSFPLLCGGGLDVMRDLLREHGREKLARWASIFFVVVALVDGLAFDVARFQHVFDMNMNVAARGTSFFQIVGEWRAMMNNVMAGHGAIGCDEEAPLQRAEKLDEGPVPQVKLADERSGQLGKVTWTPNRVTVHVSLIQPATVTFNQNWNEHWKSTAGQVVRFGPKVARDRDGGRLAVEAPAGDYDLTVYYRPRSFVVGATATALSIPLAVLFWVWRRRRSLPGYVRNEG
jgi:hypothetical protein